MNRGTKKPSPSTTGQHTENQRLELKRVAERRGWTVVEVYEDASRRNLDRSQDAVGIAYLSLTIRPGLSVT
jgi:hypothetical protein